MDISYNHIGPKNHLNRTLSEQDVFGLAALGVTAYDKYALCNSSSFRPGELEKLRENDRKLDDCRERRKTAILRISRMVQNLV